MQYETNQNTRLIIRHRNTVAIAESAEDILLEIENYVGAITHFEQYANLIINKHSYEVCNTTYEFSDNKPVLTIYVYDKR
jgi:hypothetical protein